MKIPSKRDLCKLITDMFEGSMIEETLSEHVKLKISSSLLRNIGSLSVKKDLNKATMQINLFKVIKGQKTQEDVIYQAYHTIEHEKEHAKTIFLTQRENFYSFEHMISLMEYLYYASRFKVDFGNISLKFSEAYLFRKQFNRNYDLSATELVANVKSYTKLREKYGAQFSEEKRQTCDQIISSLGFLNDNMEVYYDENKEPINRFVSFVFHTSSYINKYPKVFDKYKILGHLFNSDGTVKNIYEIYLNINSENEEMYRKLMISYLTSINADYSLYLTDSTFKGYLGELISEYIANTIDYYKNIDKGNIFINKSSVLSDNFIVKKNNIKILSGIAQKYGLQLSGGMVLDSNNMYVNKLIYQNKK